jgi:hypothetical protein
VKHTLLAITLAAFASPALADRDVFVQGLDGCLAGFPDFSTLHTGDTGFASNNGWTVSQGHGPTDFELRKSTALIEVSYDTLYSGCLVYDHDLTYNDTYHALINTMGARFGDQWRVAAGYGGAPVWRTTTRGETLEISFIEHRDGSAGLGLRVKR